MLKNGGCSQSQIWETIMAAQINRPTLREQQSYELKKKKKESYEFNGMEQLIKGYTKKIRF